jgi:methionyl-tRNA formyltransferase
MKILCCTYRKWAKEIYNNLENEFPNHQFIRINSKTEYENINIPSINPDLILWYGWSWIIPELLLTKYYSVMLHPSPLPKYRGGSPIQNQIINGEKESAVTLFKMDGGIDTGDIIYQQSFDLDHDLNNIFNYITKIGTSLSSKMIKNFKTLKLTPQNNNESTYYKRRTPDQSEITFQEILDSPSKDLYNKIRALQDPYPNAFIKCKDGTKLYLTKAHI